MDEQSSEPKVVIEVWADMGCPWCYLGKHRLQTAIAQRPDADRFTIVMRSFQLEPDAPREPEKNEVSYIRSHGGTAEQLLRNERQMQAVARSEGLEYFIDRMNANTFDLHRVVQYAADEGLSYEFFSTLQDGFFTGKLEPHDPDVMTRVAESVGLSGQRVRDILASDEYADRVLADRQQAFELGATGVPFVVMDHRVGTVGAQKVAVYAQMLEQVGGPAPSEERVA